MARAGEFTLRAFLNDRMDLSEAEAVAALVSARGERARRVALRQLAGGLGRRIRALVDEAVELLAEVEARLDFPEEELEGICPGAVQERLRELAAGAEGKAGAGGGAHRLGGAAERGQVEPAEPAGGAQESLGAPGARDNQGLRRG